MDLRGQDRKRLDGRRLGAVIIDELLFVPLVVAAAQYDFGASLLVAALALGYFFLCDATTGQTLGKVLLGLRTVTVDGDVAGPRAASARTVLRLVDHSLLGLIVLIATGGRRQRLGDLAAGTVVVRAADAPVAPRPLTGALAVWPALWLAPALAFFLLSANGKVAGTYRANADALCADANRTMEFARTPTDVVAVMADLTSRLEALDAPLNWEARHQALVAEGRALTVEASTIVARAQRAERPARSLQRHWPRLEAQVAAANARIAAMGFEDCASS